MDKHFSLLGGLHIAHSALILLIGIALWVLLTGVATMRHVDYHSGAFLHLAAIMMIVFFLVLSAPGFIGGWGIIQRRSWARIVLIIVGFLLLPVFPLGTGLGIYTLWVLLQEESAKSLR